MICRKCGFINPDNVADCQNCFSPLYNVKIYPTGRSKASKGLAIASMALGLSSLGLFFIWYLSIPMGIAAIVLGCIANGKGFTGKMPSVGITTGIIGIVISVIFLIVIVALISAGIIEGILNSTYY